MPKKKLNEMNNVTNPVATGKRGTTLGARSLQRNQPATRAFVDLNFKVSAELRRRFDRLAYEMDLKNVRLLERALDALEQHQEQEMSTAHVRLAVSIRASLNPEALRSPKHVAQRVREVLEQAFHPERPADLQVELEE